MTIKKRASRRRVKWLLWFGFWTLIGLSFAFQFYISSAKAGLEVTWRQAVGYALGDWYVFAVLSIPWSGWRGGLILNPVTGGGASRCTCPPAWRFPRVHVLRAASGVFKKRREFRGGFSAVAGEDVAFQPAHLLVIVAVTFAFDYYRKYRNANSGRWNWEKRLAEAKLQTLQMQFESAFPFQQPALDLRARATRTRKAADRDDCAPQAISCGRRWKVPTPRR